MGRVFQDQSKEQTKGALRPPDPGGRRGPSERTDTTCPGRGQEAGGDVAAVAPTWSPAKLPPNVFRVNMEARFPFQSGGGWSGVTSEARGQVERAAFSAKSSGSAAALAL